MKNFLSQNKNLTIAIVAGLLMVGGTALFAFHSLRSQTDSAEESLVVEPQIDSVMALGRLEPQGEVIDVAPAPDIGGAKAQELRVKLGDQVLPNQIVAILDSFNSKDQALKRAREEVRVAEANLAIVKAGAKQGEIDAQTAAIKTLESQLAGEVKVYVATKAGLERELAAQKQEKAEAIARLKTELANAEIEFERYRQLKNEGAVTISQFDENN
ncbi:MAG: hypothetical protein HC796_07565 [Synechococcaceae cyanobacterium RL_1_2]|nr:hypothetical protein [Synechococcaceae cyanobacterium RL_1_2]